LKGWHIKHSGEQAKEKETLYDKLRELDNLANSNPLSPSEWALRYELEDKLELILQMEELHWQHRSSENWVLRGDSNTDFFHKFANGRRRKNLISCLEGDQGVLTDQAEIEQHITTFYKSLFGAGPPRNLRLSSSFWSDRHILSREEEASLIRDFQEEEVKSAMCSMKSNSAPGPNGFGVQFFKSFWQLIGNDYLALFQDLHKGLLDIRRLNYGVITLVPKSQDANNIKQYRPICLLNVDYKGITKVLTNRFSVLAQTVIGSNQTGFVKGRNILEGVVVLHEVIHELKRTKRKGIILKIDFDKAYDKVRWDFLEEVLVGKGFPAKWINWVMQSVQGGRVCVNVNGQRGPYFRTFGGLRQGDLLSPLLFNLVADALSNMLDKAVAKGHLVGTLDWLIPGGVSHIQYADDTVIMIDGSEKSILSLKLILYCFEWLSGLKINFHKSDVYVFGEDQERKEVLANMLNCRLGEWPMKYLGLPIAEHRVGSRAFTGLVDKMRKRLDPWKGRNLSLGGRLVLTNSCLSSLPMYTMGFYLLPKSVHLEMDQIRSNFFW